MKEQLWPRLVASAVLMMFMIGSAWAARGGDPGCPKGGTGDIASKGQCVKAPEIDVGAGGGAIALLVGGLLLVAEKRRRIS